MKSASFYVAIALISLKAYTVLGAGVNVSCGQWLDARHRGTYFDMSGWALGFLSGVPYAASGYDPLKDIDAAAVLYWLDNYCQKHPVDKFSDAVESFVSFHPR